MEDGRNQSIRLFKNPILESLSHVHPITPLLLWAPIIGTFFVRSIGREDFQWAIFSLTGVFALLIWTLTEYVLHRFIFHLNARSRSGEYIIYLFHGIHHDDPQDKTRLVMPPVPAIGIIFLLFLFFKMICPIHLLDVFMGFFLIGYLIYDYIHYATHHFSMANPIGRFLKRWHLQHHHTKEQVQFVVSNPLWDFVFGTYPNKK